VELRGAQYLSGHNTDSFHFLIDVTWRFGFHPEKQVGKSDLLPKSCFGYQTFHSKGKDKEKDILSKDFFSFRWEIGLFQFAFCILGIFL